MPVISAEILQEYRRVGEILSHERATSSLEPFLALLAMNSEIVIARPLPEQVSQDASDDAFLACALAAKVNVIVSGDRHLLTVSPWRGIEVMTPRKFLDDKLGGS